MGIFEERACLDDSILLQTFLASTCLGPAYLEQAGEANNIFDHFRSQRPDTCSPLRLVNSVRFRASSDRDIGDDAVRSQDGARTQVSSLSLPRTARTCNATHFHDAFLPVRFATRVAPAASGLGREYVTDPYQSSFSLTAEFGKLTELE